MHGITEAGIVLANVSSPAAAAELLLHYCCSILEPDLAALYLFPVKKQNGSLKLNTYKGYEPEQKVLSPEEEGINFILDSHESACLLQKKESPFSVILLTPLMHSGIAAPLSVSPGRKGILFLNYLHPFRFSFHHIEQVENMIKLTGMEE